jgi:AcrR family transcriptional regulator
MQYLKDDIRDQIVRASLSEFLEKGYRDASMRGISKRSKLAIGSIYRYFDSKEAIFDYAVGPTYNRMLRSAEHLFQKISESKVTYKNFRSMELITEICNEQLDNFYAHGTEILILADKSQGTKYENYYQDAVSIIHKILNEVYLVELRKEGVTLPDESILAVIAASFTAGFYTILKNCSDVEQIQSLTHMFLVATFHNLSYTLTEAKKVDLFLIK